MSVPTRPDTANDEPLGVRGRFRLQATTSQRLVPRPFGCHLRLSEHFSLDEMTRSDTGLRRGLENAPNAGEVRNLVVLCETILEPIRSMLGVPLHINSGYRCPAVNSAVGGKVASAHMDGRAADFVPIGMYLREAFDKIKASDLPWDQLIIEFGTWIHVAIPRQGVDARRQVIEIKP